MFLKENFLTCSLSSCLVHSSVQFDACTGTASIRYCLWTTTNHRPIQYELLILHSIRSQTMYQPVLYRQCQCNYLKRNKKPASHQSASAAFDPTGAAVGLLQHHSSDVGPTVRTVRAATVIGMRGGECAYSRGKFWRYGARRLSSSDLRQISGTCDTWVTSHLQSWPKV